jgi:hypothetical protein
MNGEDRLRGEARVHGLARTAEPHHLDFTVFSEQNGCAAADIVPDDRGLSIWGVLYEIPEDLVYRDRVRASRRCLDAIEGEGTRYERRSIALFDAAGCPIEKTTLTYVVKQRRTGLLTSHHYASHIVRGLALHRAPIEYLDYVIARVRANNPEIEEHTLRRVA